MRHGTHQMTKLVLKRTKMTMQFLSPFRAREQTVLHMCFVSGCPDTPSIFWESLQETEITTFSQMMHAAMNSNLFAIVKFATSKLKMKTLPAGFTVALCSTAIQFFDRHSFRISLLLRIADFVVDAVDVVDVSVSEFVPSPPSEHLTFSDITCSLCIIVSSLIFLLSKVFLSSLIHQKEPILRMNFCPSFSSDLPKIRLC